MALSVICARKPEEGGCSPAIYANQATQAKHQSVCRLLQQYVCVRARSEYGRGHYSRLFLWHLLCAGKGRAETETRQHGREAMTRIKVMSYNHAHVVFNMK